MSHRDMVIRAGHSNPIFYQHHQDQWRNTRSTRCYRNSCKSCDTLGLSLQISQFYRFSSHRKYILIWSWSIRRGSQLHFQWSTYSYRRALLVLALRVLALRAEHRIPTPWKDPWYSTRCLHDCLPGSCRSCGRRDLKLPFLRKYLRIRGRSARLLYR